MYSHNTNMKINDRLYHTFLQCPLNRRTSKAKPNLRRASCFRGTPRLRRARTIKSSDMSCSIRKEMTKRRSEHEQSLAKAFTRPTIDVMVIAQIYCTNSIFWGFNLCFFFLSLPQKRVSFEPTTTYLLKDLKPFTTYSFQLAARSKHGIGAYTNVISAETPQTRKSLSVSTVFPQYSGSRTGTAHNKTEILHFLTIFANVILNLLAQWFILISFWEMEAFLFYALRALLAHILFEWKSICGICSQMTRSLCSNLASCISQIRDETELFICLAVVI